MPGKNVKRGADDTLYALKNGIVRFYTKTKTRFDGSKRKATFVEVL
jgi:large subunit ribosomal protein L27